MRARTQCVLFDWGDTLMRVIPEFDGPMANWPRIEIIPSAQETLSSLQADWIIALATNAEDSSEDEIRRALARVKLDKIVERVYCFRKIGLRKPSSAFFEFILNDLGVSSSSVVMVGDNYEFDVVGATRSGIRAVWFNRHSEEVQFNTMQRTIHDLKELPTTLRGWELDAEK